MPFYRSELTSWSSTRSDLPPLCVCVSLTLCSKSSPFALGKNREETLNTKKKIIITSKILNNNIQTQERWGHNLWVLAITSKVSDNITCQTFLFYDVNPKKSLIISGWDYSVLRYKHNTVGQISGVFNLVSTLIQQES